MKTPLDLGRMDFNRNFLEQIKQQSSCGLFLSNSFAAIRNGPVILDLSSPWNWAQPGSCSNAHGGFWWPQG